MPRQTADRAIKLVKSRLASCFGSFLVFLLARGDTTSIIFCHGPFGLAGSGVGKHLSREVLRMLSVGDKDSSCRANRCPQELLDVVRDGVPEQLGELLESYRNYLHLLATTQIDVKLRARVSPSDLVQETMLGAFRDFSQFRGYSQRELLAWLRQILVNRLHVFVQKHVLAGKRDVRREFSFEDIGAALARSSANLKAAGVLADHAPSPSADVIRRENAVVLADHLADMTPLYRDVIALRNLQGLSFDQVARRLNRSCGATRMLWLRAIKQLRERMEPERKAESP